MTRDPLLDLPLPHEDLGPIDFTPTIPNAIRRATERFGDLAFMVDDQRTITFAEADAITARMACGLVALGAGKGSRIAIMMPNCTDWVLAFLAVARMGGHQNRKSDGPPGWLTLWRGWHQLVVMVHAVEAVERCGVS